MLRKGTRRSPKATRLPHLAEHAGRGGKLVGNLFGQSSARLRQSFKSLPMVRAHETPERPQREKQARVERPLQSFTRIWPDFYPEIWSHASTRRPIFASSCISMFSVRLCRAARSRWARRQSRHRTRATSNALGARRKVSRWTRSSGPPRVAHRQVSYVL